MLYSYIRKNTSATLVEIKPGLEHFQGFEFVCGKIQVTNHPQTNYILNMLDAMNQTYIEFGGSQKALFSEFTPIDVSEENFVKKYSWWNQTFENNVLPMELLRCLTFFKDILSSLKDKSFTAEEINSQATILFLYQPLSKSLKHFLLEIERITRPFPDLELALIF